MSFARTMGAMLNHLLKLLQRVLVYFFITLALGAVVFAIIYSSLSVADRTQLLHLFSRVLDTSLRALSQTKLSYICYQIASPVAAFLLTLAILNKVRPAGVAMEQVRDAAIAAAVGLAVPLVILMGTFGWKLVDTVYHDHHDMAGRWRGGVFAASIQRRRTE